MTGTFRHRLRLSRPPAGKNLMVSVGKDGIVHGVDTAAKTEIYKTPNVTQLKMWTRHSRHRKRDFVPEFRAVPNGTALRITQKRILFSRIRSTGASIVNLGPKSPPPGRNGQTLHRRGR